MSATDQCPSSNGKGTTHATGAGALAARARELPRVNGERAWRSLDEWIDTPEFREHLEKEFPHGALEMQRAFENASDGGETRRDFLKVMGASMALAGVAVIPGCRRPDHKILSYSREVPEEIIPGKPLYYATAMPRPDGGAEGLIVESHEGRPTKIEGNPLHPINQGRASSWAIASVLGLYDPDRLKYPRYRNPARAKSPAEGDADPRLDATWDDFRAWAADHFKQHAGGDQGAGLAFIVEKRDTPAWNAARAAVMETFPKATWVAYDPVESASAAEGSAIAFDGKALRPRFRFSAEGTRVIVSFGHDFLMHNADEVANARSFAASRRVMTTKDPMSRLYVVEGTLTATGGQADHRLRLAPSRIPAFVATFARFLLPKLASPDTPAIEAALAKLPAASWDAGEQRFLEECAKDLADAAHREKSVVMAGDALPKEVHALVHAMNAALGNIGKGVVYATLGKDHARATMPELASLAAAMGAGRIKTLVCVGVNPVYDAPADLDFAAKFAKVPATITLGVGQSETALASTWSLNGTHYLESWGDAAAADGTISPVQPMIAPLYEPAMSDLEFLALLAGRDFKAKIDGYELVRAAWRKALGEAGFESSWRRALHDGVVAGSTPAPLSPKVNFAAVAEAVAGLKPAKAPSEKSLDVVFTVGHVGDGRFANCAWLQELPQFGTMVVWDNPALVSPRTAKALGLLPTGYKDSDPGRIYTKPKYPMARVATLTLGGRSMKVPVWIMPGMADDTVALAFGYGREASGRVADGVGFNAYTLRTSAMGRVAFGATLEPTSEEYLIASTQNHWSMEGRTGIVRAVDLAAWRKHGDEKAPGGKTRYRPADELAFGERLGELAHTPPNESIYANPFNAGKFNAEPGSVFANGPQWGMTIDLTTCTGCGACTIACQAENNIPVVGKKETAKGREMTWIRVDRYFTGEDFNDPAAIHHQPVACVHCENAPCEVVCPVNATVHGPEGINYMTYNRCIGTRYCANNCPYKVRRYNFFEYGKLEFNGDYIGKKTLDKLGGVVPGQGVGPNGSDRHNKININFIPPRLRDKIAEIERMGKNPNVSVRMRGVMEKCSYCVQRINAARIECKLQDLKDSLGNVMIPDGFFQTACQQACPSEAITFGDILDESSKVHHTRNHPRSYMLLGYLNTRPRTLHMARVMNPNPALRAPVEDPFHHGGGHEGGGAEPAAKPHAFRFDRGKRANDSGYALSLNVLGGGKA